MIYVCHNSLLNLTVRIEADRMRRTVDSAEWWFYRRTGNLIFRRWVCVGKVMNCAQLTITTETYASDHDFLKQAGVRL